MRVLIFGDSITQGFTDSKGGWANRIVQDSFQKILSDLDADDWPEVFNLGASGDTTKGVTERLVAEAKARDLYPDDVVIVVAIGTNDSLFTADKNYSTPKQYRAELSELFDEAKKVTSRVMFVGLPGVDEVLCRPWKYSSSGKSWTNERIELFDKELRDFCGEKSIPFVAVREAFAGKEKQLFADGLHPNDEGHTLIYELVKPELEKLL